MKSDTVFKRASNDLLDRLAQHRPGSPVESETKLAEAVRVSRTTIRKALRELQQAAREAGGNAVVGVDLDYEVIGKNGSMLMVSASGTAVRVE